MHLAEFRRILKQAFLVPFLTLLVLGGILFWQTVVTRKAQYDLDHCDRIRTRIAELERLIIDQETGLRGLELTHDPSMMAPYKAAEGPIQDRFSRLHDLLADNPQQLGNLAQAHDHYLLWLGFAEEIQSNPSEFTDVQQNHRGKELMDAVRESLRTMTDTEDRIRQQDQDEAASLEQQEQVVIVAGVLLAGILLSTFSLNRLRRVSSAYRNSLAALQRQSDEIFESREWLYTTLSSIGDAVIVCETSGGIQFMNPIAEELTGWPLAEVRSLPLQQVFHIINERTRQEAENPVAKVIRMNKVVGLANHTALIARNGTEYIINDSAAPIFDKDRKMIGIVLVFRDTTEEHRKEAALIASEKLAIAGRLAASIAHEIHNPLDSVANLHYLLARETDAAKRAEYLAMADQELNRTLQISRTMLNLYREPAAPVRIDMAELLESVLLLLHRRLANQQIAVEHSFKGSFIVEGFPAELRQVFTNLIINAADAAGYNGKIRITMAGIPAAELHGGGVEVVISDSGDGIPKSAKEKLFQPFFTTKGEKGTGLGLWVSQGIVQKHGGTIRVRENGPDTLPGAAIRIYLPAQTIATATSRSTAYLE